MTINLWTTKGASEMDNWKPEFNYCIVCGRKTGTNAQVVEVGVDGYLLGTTDETESQGWWTIGSECVKKVM